jgi:protein-L-isoaspartate(D-aspartate) O-methyltransferase
MHQHLSPWLESAATLRHNGVMARKPTSLDDVRSHFARQMAAASGWSDPRLERAFDLVPREAFLPPGPWRVIVAGQAIRTPNDDPIFLYQNALVTIDEEKGINNGEPFLHAAWMGAVAPQPGEEIIHIGTGGGYYTAVLAVLVLPDGHVTGIEIEADLAAQSRRNLEPFENVRVIAADAVTAELPPADIIYVNAGVVAPPLPWLEALKPGGRLIFPWRPAHEIGVGLMVIRTRDGFSARAVGGAWFIRCIGAADEGVSLLTPSRQSATAVRALVPTAVRPPDETAIAIYPDLWFSSAPVRA